MADNAPTHDTIQADHRRQMTDAILQHARNVMRERGAAGLSLGEVARRLGVKTPSLYEYFPNKHAVYDAIFRRGYEAFRNELRAIVPEGGLHAYLSRTLRGYMDFALANPELYQLMFERPIPGFVPSQQSLELSFGVLAEATQAFTRAAEEDGVTLPEGLTVAQLHDLWLALAHGITALHLANQPDTPLPESRFGSLLDAAVETFITAWATQGGDS